MPSLNEIQSQIDALPSRYIFWTAKEIRALPKILSEDERVLALTSGMMEGATWLAVCTPRRLIFVHRGMLFGTRLVQIPLDRIQSVDHEYAILFGSIRVWDGASYFTLRMVLKASIEPFVRTVQEYTALARNGPSAASGKPANPLSPAMDVASQLERLAALRDRGVLTEAEFERQKAKVLGD